MRSALQAFQLRDNLMRVACELRWLASDYDLVDALTKKRADSRTGLWTFLKTSLWSIAYDPSFTSSRIPGRRSRKAIRPLMLFMSTSRTQGTSKLAHQLIFFLGLVQSIKPGSADSARFPVAAWFISRGPRLEQDFRASVRSGKVEALCALALVCCGRFLPSPYDQPSALLLHSPSPSRRWCPNSGRRWLVSRSCSVSRSAVLGPAQCLSNGNSALQYI